MSGVTSDIMPQLGDDVAKNLMFRVRHRNSRLMLNVTAVLHHATVEPMWGNVGVQNTMSERGGRAVAHSSIR